MSVETAHQEHRLGAAPGSVGKSRALLLLCFAVAVSYYATLLCFGFPSLFTSAPGGLTFNSMLLHMLHGSFDIDQASIGIDGIPRNGLTYAYFGILPALLRLPFLLSREFASTDYTRLSCIVAVSLMAAFKLAAMLTVWRAERRPDRLDLALLFGIAILFGGSQIQFLRSAIYQEVLLWADALASAFVYLIIRGYFSEYGFTARILAALATVAGLCLLTRVSTALGLYVALGLLMLVLSWQRLRSAGAGRSSTALAPFLYAGPILAAFIVIAGVVNYGRWGDPLVFSGAPEPDIGPDTTTLPHQRFNIIRLGYALVYYFAPAWVMRTADGNLLWEAFQQRTITAVELPPGSFFLSDPLIIGLAGLALVALIRHRDAIKRAIAVPVLAGLFVPIALILTFTCMTFRYRLEFYPFFDLCAFLGFGVVLSRPKRLAGWAFAIAAFGGVMASHAFWLMYMLSPLGSASLRLDGMDVISFYLSELK